MHKVHSVAIKLHSFMLSLDDMQNSIAFAQILVHTLQHLLTFFPAVSLMVLHQEKIMNMIMNMIMIMFLLTQLNKQLIYFRRDNRERSCTNIHNASLLLLRITAARIWIARANLNSKMG